MKTMQENVESGCKMPCFTTDRFSNADIFLGRNDVEVAQQVIVKAGEIWGIKPEVISGPGRPQFIVEARHAAMCVIRLSTRLSLHTIGDVFGGRDHGTVVNAVARCFDRVDTDARYRQKFHRLQATFPPIPKQ